MAMIHKGYDIHKGTAAEMFHKAYDDVTDAERDKGKTGNFANVYGIGAAALAKSLGHNIDEAKLKPGTKLLYKTFQAWKLPPYAHNVTYEAALCVIEPLTAKLPDDEAAKVLDGVAYFFSEEVQAGLKEAADFKKMYFNKFPDIKKFIKECSKAAEDRGYVKYWTGRRRHFKNPREEGYKGPNALIQGGCGDIIKKKMYEVRQFLAEGNYATKMINNVHDELTTLHPISRRELDIIPQINKILCDLPFRVPISWGIDWGYKWGEKRKFTSLDDLYKELEI